jgi:tol-pal system protein YbgF
VTSILIKAVLFIPFVIFCVTSCASQKDMVYLNSQVSALIRQANKDRERVEQTLKELERAIGEQGSAQGELEDAIGIQESRQSELERALRTYREEQEATQRRLQEERNAAEAEQEAGRKEAIRVLKTDQESLRTAMAQLEADLLGIKEDIQTLTGRIEEGNYLLKGAIEKDTTKADLMASQIKELSFVTEDLKSRFEALENYVSAEIEAKKEEAGPEKGSPAQGLTQEQRPVPQEKTLTESELYDRALAYHRNGKFDEALADFNTFLTRYPQSQLADNAHFWIGESYRAQERYEDAILAYQKAINGYPEGNKIPAAMLHQGLAFEKIADVTSAELVFKKLIKSFPTSEEAEIARKRLEKAQ